MLDQEHNETVAALQTRVASLMAELDARERQLSEAQHVAKFGSWEWDVATNRVVWSDELFRIYGLEPGSIECTFESYLAQVVPEDRPRVRETIGAALAEEDEFDFQERIVRADDEIRVLRSRGRVVRDAAGRAFRLLGTCQDVTDRVDASAQERALAREQLRRRRAEEQEQRAAFMAEAATLIASSLDYEATLRQLASLAVPRIADWCAIDMVASDGSMNRLVVAHPDPRKEELARDLQRRYPPDPNATVGVPNVVRTGVSELIPEVPAELIAQAAEDDEHARLLFSLDLQSLMIVPLVAGGRVLGTLSLAASESGSRFTTNDLRFAEDLAARAASAVQNARLFEEAEQAREELEQQSYITRTVSENATAALFMMDSAGRCSYMNAAAEAMTGFTCEEISGLTLHDAIHHHHPDGRPYPVEECPIDRVRPVETPIRAHPDVFIRKDGTYFPVIYSASPIFDRSGLAHGTVVEVRDVTEERRAQDAIRERELRLRFLADSIPVQVWTATSDGALDYVNEQVVSYFAEPAERIIGAGWIERLREDQVAPTIEAWTKAIRTGEPYEVEFLLRGADGEYRWHLARARAQRGPDGEILRWFGSNTDIHEAKAAEEVRERMAAERDAERARLLGVFEQAPAFICTLVGPDHVFESANPLYLKLIGREDIVGKSVEDALPEVVGQGFRDLLNTVYTTGQAFIGTEVPLLLQRNPGSDPEEAFLNFMYQPMRDASGAIYGIFVHGVDVTDQVLARLEVEAKADELTRLARQLQLTNEELDQFAYVASHDLKAPLRGIANLSKWIEEDLEGLGGPEVREHLQRLHGRVMRMEGLIEGILEFSRAGRLRDATVQVNVSELIAEVLDLLAPSPDISVTIDEDLPTLSTEKLPLQQVFLNLIGNALKFAPVGSSGGTIRIGAESTTDFYHFFVRDDGPGIAPEYHEKIFGIFQTLQARDDVEGTGIGLSLVKKIVENRGGRVWVESEVGAGATFHFLWPRN